MQCEGLQIQGVGGLQLSIFPAPWLGRLGTACYWRAYQTVALARSFLCSALPDVDIRPTGVQKLREGEIHYVHSASLAYDGFDVQAHAPLVQQILLQLAARYLYIEKRRSYALDPVANFHLRNGASLWRLCPMADPSPSGMQRSFGVMVNYKYVLEDVAAHNHSYIVDGTISASPAVKQLTSGRGPQS